MKKILLIISAALFASAAFSQKSKPHKIKAQHEKVKKMHTAALENGTAIWEGTSGAKPSKNQPAKVREAFQRDYPQALGTQWSKYRGDWTASFTTGLLHSTAVYHANGERKDTRTLVQPKTIPQVILDGIRKKRPAIIIGNAVKIELPGNDVPVFRLHTTNNGNPEFYYYNNKGVEVKYDY